MKNVNLEFKIDLRLPLAVPVRFVPVSARPVGYYSLLRQFVSFKFDTDCLGRSVPLITCVRV